MINDKLSRGIIAERFRRFMRHENAVLATILVGIIVVMAAITRGATLRLDNMANVWLQSSARGLASIGQMIVILTGGIDLSVGGLGLMAAILGARLMEGHTQILLPVIGAMLLLGIGIGLFNGILVSAITMPALIVTLGMWRITYGASFLLCGGKTIYDIPEGLAVIGGAGNLPVPVPVVMFIGIAVVAYLFLNYTSFGRSIYAVGGNAVSSWLSGLNVKQILTVVYIISGFMASLAGLVMLGRTMCGGMITVANLELDSIASVVIGGVSLMGGSGTVIGVVMGVMIMGVITNGLNVIGIPVAYYDVIKGSIIIAAVAIDYIRRRR